jgi:hypothetical protein
MNQPQNPVPPSGNRPQLFSAPAATSANANKHADVGPSILSTIDGGQARSASQRDHLSVKRVLLMGALALLALAIFAGVKFYGSSSTPPSELIAVHATPVAPVAAKAAEAAPSAPRTAELAQGAAAIETVAPQVLQEVPAPSPSSNLAASAAPDMSKDQLVPNRPEAAPVAAKAVQQPVRKSPTAPSVAKPASKRVADSDAELLAAMLPHLKRTAALSSSPAYEKRCGQLTGDAAVNCRSKFCKGREGADPACPAALESDQR